MFAADVQTELVHTYLEDPEAYQERVDTCLHRQEEAFQACLGAVEVEGVVEVGDLDYLVRVHKLPNHRSQILAQQQDANHLSHRCQARHQDHID
jgi:hypothetical protein